MITGCQKCRSQELIVIFIPLNTECIIDYLGNSYNGPLPSELKLGTSDVFKMKFCKACGQIQNLYPLVNIEKVFGISNDVYSDSDSESTTVDTNSTSTTSSVEGSPKQSTFINKPPLLAQLPLLPLPQLQDSLS